MDDNTFTEKKIALILTKENYREWFKTIEMYLEIKSVNWVLEQDQPAVSIILLDFRSNVFTLYNR